MKVNLSKKWKFAANSALSSSDITDFAWLSTGKLLAGMAFNVHVVWPRRNQWKRALYNYNNFVCTTVVAWWISHLSPKLTFQETCSSQTSWSEQLKKKRRKTKMNRIYWYILFFACASYNWAITFPKQSQNALVTTPNLAFSSEAVVANITQAQEQQVLCQMKTTTNAGATDKHKCKGREGQTLILEFASSPFKWPVKRPWPAYLPLRLYMRLCLLS